jgi:hypothetical protein
VFRRSKPMQIERNIAKLEENIGEYRIVVTVERQNAATISEDEAERALTKAELQIFQIERYRFGGTS